MPAHPEPFGGGRESADLRSSGDLLADRRYAYAEAAFADGDVAVAADLARQTLELAPGFTAAWMLLGRAREAEFRAAGSGPDASAAFRDAVSAFESARATDPADRLGAAIALARLGAGDPLAAVSPGYVRALFDDYAGRFDRHLRQGLLYRGPEILHDAVRRACALQGRPFRFGRAVDLGCGTGLAGEAFRAVCGTLAGVDLSPAMLRRADAKAVYDSLEAGDLVDWLRAEPDGAADLALAADTAVYLGDLGPFLAELARVVAPGGLVAVTTQEPDDPEADAVLGADHRFAHGAGYLAATAGAAGLAVVLSESVSTRQDRGNDVPGRALVLERPR